MMARSSFLDRIQAAAETARTAETAPTEAPGKLIEEMSAEELEAAETAVRRELLDLQHREVREQELARVAGDGEPTGRRASGLTEVLRQKQRKKRRTWR